MNLGEYKLNVSVSIIRVRHEPLKSGASTQIYATFSNSFFDLIVIFDERQIRGNLMAKIRVLIPDGEWEILTNHVKDCLAGQKGVALFVMSNKPFLPSACSRFVRKYLYYPKTDNPASWIAHINEVCVTYRIDVVMPVYENGIRSLIMHKSLLQEPWKLAPLPGLKSFDTATNKLLLSRFMKENDVPAPAEIEAPDNAGFNLEGIAFPILAKPLHITEGGRGIKRLENEQAFRDFVRAKPPGEAYLYQEYIRGYDIDCSVLCRDGKILSYTLQRGIFYGSQPFAPAQGVRFVHDQGVLPVVEKLMQCLNWSGIAHIDLRFDQVANNYKVIEINARFWTSLDASLAAGINFPACYLALARGTTLEKKSYDLLTYYSLKGLVGLLRREGLFSHSPSFLYRNSSLRYVLKDPVPAAMKLLMHFRNRILRHRSVGGR